MEAELRDQQGREEGEGYEDLDILHGTRTAYVPFVIDSLKRSSITELTLCIYML